MGCYTCQYYNDARLCGLGEKVTYDTRHGIDCPKYIKGEGIRFTGEIVSQWKYTANPKSLEQLPKKLRTLCKQPVIHYEHKKDKLELSGLHSLSESWVCISHLFVFEIPPGVRIKGDEVIQQLSLHYGTFKDHCFRPNIQASDNYCKVTYYEFYKPNEVVSLKHQRKAKRKDKAQLNNCKTWHEDLLTKQKGEAELKQISEHLNKGMEAKRDKNKEFSKTYSDVLNDNLDISMSNNVIRVVPTREIAINLNLDISDMPVFIIPPNGSAGLRISQGGEPDPVVEGTIRISSLTCAICQGSNWHILYTNDRRANITPPPLITIPPLLSEGAMSNMLDSLANLHNGVLVNPSSSSRNSQISMGNINVTGAVSGRMSAGTTQDEREGIVREVQNRAVPNQLQEYTRANRQAYMGPYPYHDMRVATSMSTDSAMIQSFNDPTEILLGTVQQGVNFYDPNHPSNIPPEGRGSMM